MLAASALCGLFCALLANSLKKITEHYESIFFGWAQSYWFVALLLPPAGLLVIYFLRQHVFMKKENKGIKEIYDSLKTRHNELPAYKIPSHYVNGLLTVASGGSTGIEVSTVVASASIGAVWQKKGHIHNLFRREMIGAAVAAGVTALFNSPLAGILFSLEVISKKISPRGLASTLTAVTVAWGFNMLMHENALFTIPNTQWHVYALPYFLLLGIAAGFNAVYLTRCVLFFKAQFYKINKHIYKIVGGGLMISLGILFFPQLYGDGYFAMHHLFDTAPGAVPSLFLLAVLLALVLLKPIISSATLAAGGDGGVFAPSLFIGAFLGLLVALFVNRFFNAGVIPLNFMVAGMGAVLSASLHAPFTAIFLVCGITGNYGLILPLGLACFASKLTAQLVFPYTVYNPPVKS